MTPDLARTDEKPLASIVIPSYNHAGYVSDAIRSVLAQEYPNYEIIVVDDGSSDHTRQVVGSFGDKVRYIYQENQGLSAARNTGILSARGEFIGVLDADDFYEPDFLSTLVALLDEHPDADGAYCGYQFVDQDNAPLYERQTPSIAPEKLFETLVYTNPFVPEAMFLRKRCYIESGLFDASLRADACADWNMWLTVSKKYRIIGTQKVLTRHRVLVGSMSSNPARMFNDRLAVVQKHFGPEPQTDQVWSPASRLAYGGAYRISAIEYLQTREVENAYTCFRKMALIHPPLLADLGTFYELGCGDQAKGFRGQAASLDLEQSAKLALGMVEDLYSEPDIPGDVRAFQRTAFATAHYALGLLEYNQGNPGRARYNLLKALSFDLKFGLKKQLVFTLVKTCLGKRILTRLKQIRRPRA